MPIKKHFPLFAKKKLILNIYQNKLLFDMCLITTLLVVFSSLIERIIQ
jgi:hypothetical protein